MTVLVVGSTGLVGFETCRRLTDAGQQVRALVRSTTDGAKQQALRALGADLITGDLKDPASLAAACAGVDAVISTGSATRSRQTGDSIESVDHLGQLALVDAARQAGVGRFVFVSFREHPDVQFPLTVAKRAVERALIASGMTYTILQASYFMEVWLTPHLGFDPVNGRVRLYGDGNQPISWISFRDVATATAAAIIEDIGRNSVVELGGPEALTPRDVVRLFEAAGAPEIAIETVPVPALRAQLETGTDSLAQTFAGLMLQYAAGDAMDPASSERFFASPRTTVRDFVGAQLADTRG